MRRSSALSLVTAGLAALTFSLPVAMVSGQSPNRVEKKPAILLCDKGTFTLKVGTATIGREDFDIRCAPDGSATGTGHTVLGVPGLTGDFTTTIELAKDLRPRRVTVIGTSNGSPMNDTLTFAGSRATLRQLAGTQEVPVAAGSAYVGNNVNFSLMPLLALYDVARGGVQTFPVFPNLSASIEALGSEAIPMSAGSSIPPLSLNRIAVQLGPTLATVWTDADGRVATIVVPAANFVAVREEFAAMEAALRAASARPSARTGAMLSPPDYGAPAGAPYTAEEVTVPANGYTLAGTLLIPQRAKGTQGASARVPAVITITGSGQQTRDEPLPIAGLAGYRPMRQIAEELASSGIAVLRVDDRGVGGSTGRETLRTATTSSFADDVRAQVAFLRARPDIAPDRIALVGHSEGGIIAPMVAATDPRIAAIVLLAGTGKSGAETSLDQQRALLDADTMMTVERKAAMRALQEEAIRDVRAGKDTVAGQPVVPWMREYFTYEPLPTIRTVRQPILILQGERDQQVPPDNARLLDRAARESGNRDVTTRVFPTLNHLFLPSTTGAVAEYSSLTTQTLGADLLGAMREWLRTKLRVRG
ncbi:MAG: alpha/beta fold hydrolase [Gemmatimonadaceae bacterium]